MDNRLFTILVFICIITHAIRTAYEILKHKEIIRASKLTFILVFINMLLLWASWSALCFSDIRRIDLPAAIRYSGIVLVVFGIVIFLSGLITIKALESYEGDLITQGIYSKIRHPMYLGFILWLIGLPLFEGGLYSFVLCVVFTANILFWRHLEEKELTNRFPAYEEYKKTTLF